MRISVNIPHLGREFDVNLPETVTGERLFNALLQKTPSLMESDENVYELFSKRVGKKVYPDFKGATLKDIGIMEGDTIIVKRDLDPGMG